MDAFLATMQQVLDYLHTIKITDLIDIAIISYLFYRIILFAKETRAGQVLRGIGLVIFLLWIANVFNLHILAYILSKAVELGFLALVVVFQPEIRHFLEKMGSGSLRLTNHNIGQPSSDLETAIDQTVEAYAAMSKDKVGALVVFERNSILDATLKTGTVLDAEVSSELLKNIFYPNAPLHDGAVVVRKGKIVAAACMLPMSESMNLSKELGMRHRAGLGMSERSDAVVAIVSEETGAISTVVNGNLRRHLSPETLGRILRNELLPREWSETGKSQGKGLLFWKGKGGQS